MDSEWAAPASGPELWAGRSLVEKSNRHADQPDSSLISKYDTMGPCGRFILWTSHLHVHMSTLDRSRKKSCCRVVVLSACHDCIQLNAAVWSTERWGPQLKPQVVGRLLVILTKHIGSWVCSFSSPFAWSHALCKFRIRDLKSSNALLPS